MKHSAFFSAACCIAFVVSFSPQSRADRGMIPLVPSVTLSEPNQDAAIAWNGKEEVLLLSTDLKASEDTKVLEVLPLPSEPKVEKGSDLFFAVADNVIRLKLYEEKKRKKKNGGKRAVKGDGEGGGEPPAGKITLHEKIGAHDISVAQVLDGKGFVEWVTKYLEGQGIDAPEIPLPMKGAIEAYLKSKTSWFVFDVVSLGPQMKRHDAILYTFKTKKLYYPLRIMKTIEGYTSIRLLIMSNKLLSWFKGFPKKDVSVPRKPVTVTQSDFMIMAKKILVRLKSEGRPQSQEEATLLAETIGRIFGIYGPGKKVKLREWSIYGQASKLDKDLLVK
jgi:hypothetical protein